MTRFIVRRTLAGLVVIFGVVVLVFLVGRVISDPAATRLSTTGTEEQVALLREQLGFSRPLWEQFVDYIVGILKLDLGESLWQDLPASTLVFQRLPATFQLIAGALAITVLVFVPLGIIASLKPGSVLDRAITVLTLGGISAPPFWVGVICILVFAVWLGWLPSSGDGSLRHLILPAVCLALPRGARVAQVTRTAMIEQMSSPYVMALRQRGFAETQIVRRHVFRNALLPIITILFWEMAQLISGSVIIETVFAWPGLGRLLIQSYNQHDLVLLQAGVLVLAFLVVMVNFFADVFYRWVDPRVQLN